MAKEPELERFVTLLRIGLPEFIKIDDHWEADNRAIGIVYQNNLFYLALEHKDHGQSKPGEKA